MHDLLFCAHTLCIDSYAATERFYGLVAKSLLNNTMILCFVHGRGQKKRPNTYNKKLFFGFHKHYPLLTMSSLRELLWQWIRHVILKKALFVSRKTESHNRLFVLDKVVQG